MKDLVEGADDFQARGAGRAPGDLNYRLERGETVAAGIRRVVGEQIAAAIAVIEDSALSPDVAVHEIRKACKRVRAALRLVRENLGDYRPENRRFRDLSRTVSTIRDLQVLTETHRSVTDRLRRSPGRAGVEIVDASVHAYRDAGLQALGRSVEDTLADVGEKLRSAQAGVAGWRLSVEDSEGPVLGIRDSYRLTKSAGRLCMDDPTTARLHEWRKQAKYHWYQLQLVAGGWPEARGARGRAVESLADALGEDHDLAHYMDVLEGIRTRVRALKTLLAGARERRELLYRESLAIGARWFSGQADEFSGRFRTCWRSWREG